MRFLLLIFILTGCTSVFFQPSKTAFPASFENNITPRPLKILSTENIQLSAWYFATQKPKAIVIQFHGNAQNISTHFQSLHWLTKDNFDLLTFDYRGYGDSEGAPSMIGVYNDALAALKFADQLASQKHLPLVTIGQSLGGSVLLKALEEFHPVNLKAIVIEGSFYSYRQIAREKLDLHWLTRPFKFTTSFLISDIYSPGGPGLKTLPHVPKYLLYSAQDPVVPVHHGTKLFNDMNEPKKLLIHQEPGHINAFFIQDGKRRGEIVRELEKAITAKN